MCVFRELSAIGMWTNYAKQMVDQFLNAERERERELGILEISIPRSRSRKSFECRNILLFLGFETTLSREKKRKRERKKVICVNELY